MSVDRSVGATSPEGFIELESNAGAELGNHAGAQPVTPADVVSFWQEAGKAMWFGKDANFDRCFRENFLSVYDAARRGALDGWPVTPNGVLALLILLDQFPRNAFRGTRRMYESGARACDAAHRAIAEGYDRQVSTELRRFIYLPLCHSEDLADHDRAVELIREFDVGHLQDAERHRDIIRRFGRFPHRNAILGRAMRDEEQHFLDQGGFAG